MSRPASPHSGEDPGSSSEPSSSATSYSSDCSSTLVAHHERWCVLGDNENDSERCRALVGSPGLIGDLLPDHVIGFDVLKAVERVDISSLPLFGRRLQRWQKNDHSEEDPQGFESSLKDIEAIITPMLDDQSRALRRRWARHSGDTQWGYDLVSLPAEDTVVLNGPVHAVIRIAKELTEAEVQIAVFAKELFMRQRNRRFVLGIALADGKLSFLLADRAGIVVSEAYDARYRIDVFLRVCIGLLFVDISRLGYDPAVTQEDKKTFIQIAGERYQFKRGIIKDHDLEGTGLRIALLEKDGKEYVMKEVWIDRARDTKEFDIFREISALDIEGIARYVSHDVVQVNGEVDSTELARQAWLDNFSQALSSNTHLVKDHHRIVMTPYGVPLQKFRSLEELVSALKDVVLTVQELDKHKLLHHDLSTENIILVDQGTGPRKGVLIDFEYAMHYDLHAPPERLKRAVGSVPFMSHRVLDYLGPKYYDELESILYILCWICTSLAGHNDCTRYFTAAERKACNGAIGAHMRRDDDYDSLASRKLKLIKSSEAFKDVLKDFHPFFHPLQSLAEDMRSALMETDSPTGAVGGELEMESVLSLRDRVFTSTLKGFDTCMDEIRGTKLNANAKSNPSPRPVLETISEHGNGNILLRQKEREKRGVGVKGCAKEPTDENKENHIPVPVIPLKSPS